jgi:release factor glutamine methyltransferase
VTLGEALRRATAELERRGVDSARLDAELIIAHALRLSRLDLYAQSDRELTEDELAFGFELVERRARREPLAYVLGEWGFRRLTLRTDRRALVPRPETEIVVERALALLAQLDAPRVVDVGTGSGAIALAVKHACVHAKVTGVDVSAAALAVARANAERLGLAVRWLESSWFAAVGGERFDVIASNPPYVRSADVGGALAFEPRLALDGGSDGCRAYRMLLGAAPAHLNAGGALVLEHGAEQRAELVALAERSGWRVAEMHDDLAGRPRVLVLELERSAAP